MFDEDKVKEVSKLAMIKLDNDDASYFSKEIIDFLKFKFLSKKLLTVGKEKNENITKILIAENLNTLFFFCLSLILLFFVRLTINFNIIIIN